MWDKMMTNEMLKNGAINKWLGIALDKEILVWTVSNLINIIRNR
jgi:hypothetical protein